MKGNHQFDTLVASILAISLALAFIIFLVALLRILKARGMGYGITKDDVVSHGLTVLLEEMKTLKDQLLLKERLAALGEISAAIIHQIRNPLSVIAGYAKLLLKSFDENDHRARYAEAILTEIQSINQVMEGLMELSKSSHLNKEPLELFSLIKEIVSEMDLKGSQVVLEPFEAKTLGDRMLIKQAIKNLIQNATEMADKVAIRAIKEDSQDLTSIEIRDNGPGIPLEEREKVFLPFYSRKPGGTGVGLTLSQKIIYSHNGSIEVRDAEEGGTSFVIKLPRY